MKNNQDTMYKMYCVFSKSSVKKMQGVRGKMAAQAGHAFLHAYWDSLERFPENAKNYKSSKHAYKIACIVETDLELEKLLALKEYVGLADVADAGFTVFGEPTRTCVGIGPVRTGTDIANRLQQLKLFS